MGSIFGYNLGKIFLDVDVLSEIVFDVKPFVFSLLFETSSEIPVSAGDECKVIFFEVV